MKRYIVLDLLQNNPGNGAVGEGEMKKIGHESLVIEAG